mmetsp:Transcript_93210/g.301392  ORF Transcript_93210/g.301392 Transcript_93210/m.301392 type:complete len:669 (-) Transcript_93210:4-2010(-)
MASPQLPSSRYNGYSLVGTTDEANTELLAVTTVEPDADGTPESHRTASEIDSPIARATRGLDRQLEALDAKETDLMKQLDDFNGLWARRRLPLEEEIDTVRKDKVKVGDEIKETIRFLKEASDTPKPPGPASFAWVDGALFAAACNIMVGLNLGTMYFAQKYDGHELLFKLIDHVFLVWYVTELSSKLNYHRTNFLIGQISIVWWNWLDTGIVLSGVLDQWVMPVVMSANPGGGGIDPSAVRLLRCLRLFRLLRALKLLKVFFKGEMAWTESTSFEVFMSSVIAANAVVMSLELDVAWAGWPWVENLFLAVYSFELAIRLKKQGLYFFIDTGNLVWNYLDTTMVVGGVLDLWLMPLIHAVQATIYGKSDGSGGGATNIMSLLKMMRIMRVLRLVRLLRAIKPLYRLLLGVIESLKAMQWVIILTMLMLYTGAIFWTSLVGKGLMYGGAPIPKQGLENFGNVPTSLFSLFKLMNGDTEIVSAVTTTVFGQLLFAAFMVLANWAILAILTSVVSDNMISASARALEEDQESDKQAEYAQRMTRLRMLFKEIDTDGSGTISEKEWDQIFRDKGLASELCDATALTEKDLRDLFTCIAVESEARERLSQQKGLPARRTSKGTVAVCSEPPLGRTLDRRASRRLSVSEANEFIHYDDFIEHLKDPTQWKTSFQ